MKRSKPLRRTAFRRSRPEGPTAAREQHPQSLVPTLRPLSRGTYAGGATGPVPKPEAYRDPVLLEMARGRPCLLMVPAICNHRVDTTVACHSNWREHGGKGGARKADDTYSVWGCFACHYWLDFGKARAQDKEAAFMEGHARQVLAWRLIAMDASESERFRKAARRALEALNATPIGETP